MCESEFIETLIIWDIEHQCTHYLSADFCFTQYNFVDKSKQILLMGQKQGDLKIQKTAFYVAWFSTRFLFL